MATGDGCGAVASGETVLQGSVGGWLMGASIGCNGIGLCRTVEVAACHELNNVLRDLLMPNGHLVVFRELKCNQKTIFISFSPSLHLTSRR
jgi:hypothetical protein